MTKLDTTLDSYRVLFLTGSQHLYGPETLAQVAEQSRAIAEELGAGVPVRLDWRPVLDQWLLVLLLTTAPVLAKFVLVAALARAFRAAPGVALVGGARLRGAGPGPALARGRARAGGPEPCVPGGQPGVRLPGRGRRRRGGSLASGRARPGAVI